MPAVPIIAAVGTVASVGLGVRGAIAGSQAQRKAGDAAMAQGEFNAGVLERQAEQTERVMGYRLGQFDERAGQFSSTQRAATFASGVEMEGSAAKSRDYSLKNLRRDRANLHDQFKTQADEYRNRAEFALEHGATQQEIANTNAWQIGLQGASNVIGTTTNFLETAYQNDWFNMGPKV